MARSAWGLEADPELDWRRRAACGPGTAEWFWVAAHKPGRSGPGAGSVVMSADNRAAMRLCAACPVRQDCYDEAAASDDRSPRIAGGVLWNRKGEPAPLVLAPCGTQAAARRHRRDREPMDEACAAAERTGTRARRAA